jgi:hypothetical protein
VGRCIQTTRRHSHITQTGHPLDRGIKLVNKLKVRLFQLVVLVVGVLPPTVLCMWVASLFKVEHVRVLWEQSAGNLDEAQTEWHVPYSKKTTHPSDRLSRLQLSLFETIFGIFYRLLALEFSLRHHSHSGGNVCGHKMSAVVCSAPHYSQLQNDLVADPKGEYCVRLS